VLEIQGKLDMTKAKTAGQQGGGIAYSYIRFSRPEQADGDSLRRQTERAEAYCKRKGLTLDTSLTLHDLGRSAFRGDNAAVGNFRLFLEAISSGDVQPGSTLIVESWDRLSRQGIDEGYDLVKRILKAGVKIATLSPEREFDRDATKGLTKGALEIQLILERASEESERKSERCGQAWRELKKKAATERKPITRVAPAWLEVRDGKFHLIPEKAAIVRRIYALARDGYGIDAIVKTLNREGVRSIGVGKRRGRHWTSSYVAAILITRAVVGEYQPHSGKPVPGNPKARQPDGPPVPNYFPAVITEDEWHATRASIKSRAGKVGRRATSVNVFKGLLHDARTRTPMHVMGHRRGSSPDRRGPAVIYPYAFTRGESKFLSFPLPVFEAAVLGQLREVDPRAVLPADTSADEPLVLAGKLAEVEGRIDRIKAKLVGDAGDLEPLFDVLKKLEADRKKKAAELAEARQRVASPLGVAWDQTCSLAAALASATDQADARTRLQAALRRVVSEIWVLVVRGKGCSLCAVQVWFSGGNEHRDYLIWHQPARSGFLKVPRPEEWNVRSLALPGKKADFDLRKPKDAAALEQALAKVPATPE
jgi:DNA invertase Pin-like site-specific DNA recombinase